MSFRNKVQKLADDLRFYLGAKLSAETAAVTMSSNAGELNATAGRVTSEALTTAAAGAQALTLSNNLARAGDLVIATINGGTSTTGTCELKAVAGAGQIVFTLTNRHASAAFNGTFIVGFVLVRMI